MLVVNVDADRLDDARAIAAEIVAPVRDRKSRSPRLRAPDAQPQGIRRPPDPMDTEEWIHGIGDWRLVIVDSTISTFKDPIVNDFPGAQTCGHEAWPFSVLAFLPSCGHVSASASPPRSDCRDGGFVARVLNRFGFDDRRRIDEFLDNGFSNFLDDGSIHDRLLRHLDVDRFIEFHGLLERAQLV